MKNAYVLVLGISMLIAALTGLLTQNHKYYVLMNNTNIQISKEDYLAIKSDKYYPVHEETSINYPLMLISFMLVAGLGAVLTVFRIDKFFKLLQTKFFSRWQLVEQWKSFVRKHYINSFLKKGKLRLEWIKLRGILKFSASQKTLLLVLVLCSLDTIIFNYTSFRNNTVSNLLGHFIAPILFSYALGALLIGAYYLINRNVKVQIDIPVRIVVTLIVISSSYVNTSDYYKIKSELEESISNTKKSTEDTTVLDGYYKNIYMSHFYPKDWKIAAIQSSEYLSHVGTFNQSEMNEDYISLKIGISKVLWNPGHNLYEVTKEIRGSVLHQYRLNSIKYASREIYTKSLGNKTFCSFVVASVYDEIIFQQYFYVIHGKKYIAVICFTSHTKDRMQLQEAILNSIQLN